MREPREVTSVSRAKRKEISAAFHVSFARPVASLAAVPLGAFPGIQRGYKVRRVFKVLVKSFAGHVLMAGFAGCTSHVVPASGCRCRRLDLFLFSNWLTGILRRWPRVQVNRETERNQERSEEHTSELQSQSNLVCRLLLEKKK